MTKGDVNDHSAYALFSLPSDADQKGVTMYVGSDDAIKVWLNGNWSTKTLSTALQVIFKTHFKWICRKAIIFCS